MEWKTYYRDEFSSPEAGPFLERQFEAHSEDPLLDRLVDRGAILSFPHTSLFYGGDAHARVVSSLYRTQIDRVIALGVFHVWGLDESRDRYAEAMDPHGELGRRRAAFDALRGGFLAASESCDTPFGPVELTRPAGEEPLRRDVGSLLAAEYSLDTFVTLLRYYGVTRQAPLPELVAVYVGMTRNPVDGSFRAAAELATSLSKLRNGKTAVVATGDLTHYGTGYTPDDLLAGRPTDLKTLEPLLQGEVEAALELVVRDKDYAGAFPILDRRLNNDQRYLLPVISELLGPGATSKVLDFRLSDYATINRVAPPCFVASSLVAHVPDADFTRPPRNR